MRPERRGRAPGDAPDARRPRASWAGLRALVPFLERGDDRRRLPIASAGELIGSLTVVSLDPARPLDAGHSTPRHRRGTRALAVDNARLYQQQKHFLESMQRRCCRARCRR